MKLRECVFDMYLIIVTRASENSDDSDKPNMKPYLVCVLFRALCDFLGFANISGYRLS